MAVCLLATCALLAAACGGDDTMSSSPTDSPRTTVAGTTSTPAETKAPQTRGSSPTPLPTADPSLARCLSEDLTVSYADGQGATGWRLAYFYLDNVGTSACKVAAPTAIRFVDRDDLPVPISANLTRGCSGPRWPCVLDGEVALPPPSGEVRQIRDGPVQLTLIWWSRDDTGTSCLDAIAFSGIYFTFDEVDGEVRTLMPTDKTWTPCHPAVSLMSFMPS